MKRPQGISTVKQMAKTLRERARLFRRAHEICMDVIRPSAEECARNSRAKCTTLRWAVRAEQQNDRVHLGYSDDDRLTKRSAACGIQMVTFPFAS